MIDTCDVLMLIYFQYMYIYFICGISDLGSKYSKAANMIDMYVLMLIFSISFAE